MSRILVAGAINTDLVASVDHAPEAGETVTGHGFAIYSGGKGANQAVAVARSGTPAVMLGGVGQDDFGAGRRADLEQEGIETGWIATIEDASSGVALITVEASGENRIAYIPAATLKVSPDHCGRAVEAINPAMILATNELSTVCHERLFYWARDHGVPVLFNAAPYSEDVVRLLPIIDVLVVNRGEAAALQGSDAGSMSAGELAHGLRNIGAKDIVITLGGDGAWCLVGDEAFAQPSINVDVVDTTGAGDTFCGALASEMLSGVPIREAVRYANVAGALAVTIPGAQSSIPRREQIEKALKE